MNITIDMIHRDRAVNAARLKAAREHLDALTPIVESLQSDIRIYTRQKLELNALEERILKGKKS